MTSYNQLSLKERVVIETLLDERKTIRYIACKLERDKGTISREINRNKMRDGIYNAELANQKAYQKRLNKKKQMKKIRSHRSLEYLIRQLLLRGKSPEKVSMRIQREYHTSLSGSTIRRYIHSKYGYDVKMILLEKKLLKKYKQRKYGKKKGRIPHRVSIDVRPLFISNPINTGHYECDFIVSIKGDKTVFLTLVDKFSRLKIAVKLLLSIIFVAYLGLPVLVFLSFGFISLSSLSRGITCSIWSRNFIPLVVIFCILAPRKLFSKDISIRKKDKYS